MFTGIIEEVGEIKKIVRNGASCSLIVSGNVIFDDLKLGDSIAVNGVCLTADKINGNTFTADVTPETLSRSNLGCLKPSSRVNLERAMPAIGRFGGHIVAGHVDDTGYIRSLTRDGNSIIVTITASDYIIAHTVEKGSITVDGISLTVASLYRDAFGVSVIPHTGAETTLLERKSGDKVNLECDIIGKYVERFVGKKSGITEEFLKEYGF